MNISKLIILVMGIALIVLIVKQSSMNPVDGSALEQKGALEVIHARKSVRSYTDRQVSRGQVDTLIRAGMAAPTARNVQPWFFVAVDDRALLDSLAEALPYAKMLSSASVAIVVCGFSDFGRNFHCASVKVFDTRSRPMEGERGEGQVTPQSS